jgi:hypothetical protein
VKIQNYFLIIVFAAAVYWMVKTRTRNTGEENRSHLPEQLEPIPEKNNDINNKNKPTKEEAQYFNKDNEHKIEAMPITPLPAEDLASTNLKKSTKPEYEEIFSGLDTKPWYFMGRTAEEVSRQNEVMKKYGGQKTEKFLTRLIELKENDIIYFDENTSFEKKLNELSESDLEKVLFARGNVLNPNDLSEIPLKTPICRLSFKEKLSENTNDFGHFFRVGKTELTILTPTTLGVRIVRKNQSDDSEKKQLIQTIECFVKTNTESENSYKDLNLLHLFATINATGNFIRPRID